MDNASANHAGRWKSKQAATLKYEYITQQDTGAKTNHEIVIGDPKDYNKLGHFIANSRVLITDSLAPPFTANQARLSLGTILFGKAPQSAGDFKELANMGVTKIVSFCPLVSEHEWPPVEMATSALSAAKHL